MINQVFNGMITMLMAKFMLNDVPHAVGLTGNNDVRQELEEAIAELGGVKPARQWFEEEGKAFPERFYHLTALSNVSGILSRGLSATAATQFSESVRHGVYLFVSEGDMDIFYDTITYEMYKGQRKWEDLAVISISIPDSWPLVIDPEYVEDPDNPYAFISLKPIPAGMVALMEERPARETMRWYEEHKPD